MPSSDNPMIDSAAARAFQGRLLPVDEVLMPDFLLAWKLKTALRPFRGRQGPPAHAAIAQA